MTDYEIMGNMSSINKLMAGAATTDITPEEAVFLFGYPNVPRVSEGVHDRLLSTAIFLSDGRTPLLFVASDVVLISTALARRARQRIQQHTGIPVEHMVLSATHTHSGPVTADMLSNRARRNRAPRRQPLPRTFGRRHRAGRGAGIPSGDAGASGLGDSRWFVRRRQSARSARARGSTGSASRRATARRRGISRLAGGVQCASHGAARGFSA